MKARYFTKKFLAVLAACTMVMPAYTAVTPLFAAETGLGLLIDDDFEGGLNGWGARGTDAETVELTTEEAHSGKSCIKVSNRSETWHGATCNKTSELTLGETYKFSAAIKFTGDQYSNNQNFSLQLQYNDGTDDNYKTIKSQTVTKGNWTILSGEYTIPTDATDVSVYVETQWTSNPSTQDLMDFYIDDFTATPADLPEIQQDIQSLKDVFKDYFIVGGAAQASEIAPKPGKDLFIKHYNSITFGNELKPDSVLDHAATVAYMEDHEDGEVNPQVSLRAARTLLEFAEKNNIPVRGHTLVWHSQTPDWFFKEGYSEDPNAPWASKEVMLQRLENYIKNLMGALATQYPDVKFYAWDVVNEAVDPNTATGMREPGSNNVTPGQSAWMKTVGKDFIEKAFEYARKYAPEDCKLFYNDYNEYEGKKMNIIYGILSDLKEKGLVDGMGMQSHWTIDYPSVDMIETAIRKYDSLGLEVQLTEADMSGVSNDSYLLTREASRFKAIMNKVVDLKKEGLNIKAVVFWGVTDATSWIDGCPLLFDKDYKAKDAYYSIIKDYVSGSTDKPDPDKPDPDKPDPDKPINGTVTVDVKTSPNGNSVGQRYTITANEGSIDLSKLKIVYKADGMSTGEQNFWCDNASVQLNVEPWYISLNGAVNGTFEDGALTLTFDKDAVLAAGTGTCSVDVRFAKADWSQYETLSNEKVEVYYNGELVK